MTRFPFAPLALACTLASAAPAFAADVEFTGFADGYQTVNVALSAPNAVINELAAAGGLSTTLNGGASFTTYCVDLYESISFGTTYPNYSVVAGAAHAFANLLANSDIGKLYAQGNPIVGATAQAAFQIAVWEIAYETSGSYSLATGSAQFTGGTADSSGALDLAGTWLSALPFVASGYELKVLESISERDLPGHQDVVFAVPEPSTYALMLGGLLGIGFVVRRRSLPR